MVEPILISIAAALAGKAATGLYDLVRRQFAGDPAATAELEAAAEVPEGDTEQAPIQALAERLEAAERADPEFSSALRAEWDRINVSQQAQDEGVTNQVSGTVQGNVIQGRDFHGDIRF
ncbi:hypothetical protein [Amycolatopsis aidingensis]|uniref:hypothetical protein n=1 Tax=Amycolatopsis aidingensis TaxID=2842453 RepID=UPI001C0BDD47|nr:hypothetical protein [Amycolatopsis aidingensis]